MNEATQTSARAMSHAQASACRLCGGEGIPHFSLAVLQKYTVQYYLCSRCKSLQTQEPYWLEEAYSTPVHQGAGGTSQNLNDLDTGAAQRVLSSLAVTARVANSLNLKNVLDYGGGDGLLCRLLRDYGFNAFVSDPHAAPTYAPGFTRPNFERPDLITAFEVMEHMSNPAEELAALFELQPTAFLATTTTYSGQDKDWWYLIPSTGHHIFFYSEAALQMIADRHGYELVRPGGYILFVKPGTISAAKRRFLELAMRAKPLRLYRAMLNLRSPIPENGAPPAA